ncbi:MULTISPECIES: ABC transporter permease [unclassified Cellulophaga]|uniref:ABC transporter permease n=1 Tax=unclassified Cellulophaga TaxID=2634405 RepID=UPI0026E2F5B2|nr:MULTISPECIES: ABC transporter permease [unclassified Cellulophaga]MDO6491208.1 ABC transporter permease [Cellulophaga sp. 2_MG-2023]MDO6495259.1 ABC transporter permease [Cellulophaga sp. 3_MG-2023]
MFKNHIKIAWRGLKMDKMFSALNILGLSIGLTIAILLFSFISFEKSFDKQYKSYSDIYRVLVNTTGDAFDKEIMATAPAAVAPALKEELPTIKYAARMLQHSFGETAFIKANNNNFLEKGLFWCDQELFSIFDTKFIKGDPASAITRPNTVVLSKSAAEKYFGTIDPMGKTIKVDDKTELEVTGVFEDFAKNSTVDCNLIASFSTTYFFKEPSWSNSSFETYVQLKDNASKMASENQMQQILDKNVDKQGQWYTLSLQPLSEVHLYSKGYTSTYTSRIGSISEIKNLSFLALLILLIACVNYMNLMTARSQKRAKDVGINKTLGASSKSLVARFYAETGLLTLIALCIGIALSIAIIPVFNSITGASLDYKFLITPTFIIGVCVVWLVTTLVAGSYPAFYLSGFSPSSILKPANRTVSNAVIRKALVVFQFTASVVLIVGVLVVYQQLEFMKNKDLGYKPQNVVAVSTAAIKTYNNKQALASEVKKLSSVIEVGSAQGFPGMDVSGRSLHKNDQDENGKSIQTNVADASVLDVLQLKLLAGKTLPNVKQKGDTLVDVVLNKKAIAYLGLTPEEAIGKKVDMQLGDDATIIGVVDDFNFESLHKPIGAYAFHNSRFEGKPYLLVRFNSTSITSTMKQLEAVYAKVAPDSSFDYTFLDKNMEQLYAQDRKMAQVGLLFCLLAIFVACLGLFGLAAFTAEQRKKEIGVRKVLGASVVGITQMLSKDFLKLIAVSLIVAFPVAYFVMQQWLEEFAFRVNISWFVFFIAGMCAILIALLTVSFQAIKAATANPIKSLRTE